eukprot:1152903-Pelagomonas_calceolata.AAC.1
MVVRERHCLLDIPRSQAKGLAEWQNRGKEALLRRLRPFLSMSEAFWTGRWMARVQPTADSEARVDARGADGWQEDDGWVRAQPAADSEARADAEVVRRCKRLQLDWLLSDSTQLPPKGFRLTSTPRGC